MKHNKVLLGSLSFILSLAGSLLVFHNKETIETHATAAPYTISARTIEESELSNLSNWEDVASTPLENEFQREGQDVCSASFQVMWDGRTLYSLVKTSDTLLDTWDQIEFAMNDGVGSGYYKVVLIPENGVRWSESLGDRMTSYFVNAFEDNGNRYILTKHILTDNSVLTENNVIKLNAIYWQFNGSHSSVCKYSASASASPSIPFTLVGTPQAMEEIEMPSYIISAKDIEEDVTDGDFEGEDKYFLEGIGKGYLQFLIVETRLYMRFSVEDDSYFYNAEKIDFEFEIDGKHHGLQGNFDNWFAPIGATYFGDAIQLTETYENGSYDMIIGFELGELAEQSNIMSLVFHYHNAGKDDSWGSGSLLEFIGNFYLIDTNPAIKPYTIAPRLVEEKDLSKIENWEFVASTPLVNEFQRELELECEASFQVMWDGRTLYSLVKTNDMHFDSWDQIEFAFSDGVNSSYFKAALMTDNGVRWTETIGDMMTSTVLGLYLEDGCRLLLSKHELTDYSVLKDGNSILLNAIYWQFNGSHSSVCKYSASTNASPNLSFKLYGVPLQTEAEIQFDKEKAKEVENLIIALPATITENDVSEVKSTRARYEVLTEYQKGYVSQAILSKLLQAEEVARSFNYFIAPLPSWRADLTDLSYWKDAPVNEMIYEFQRASGYTDKIEVTFQMLWDYDTIYVLVKATDETYDDADQMEFGFTNGTEASYFNTSVGGWESVLGTLMISEHVEHFDEDGYRYILTKHTLVDNSVLQENGSLVVNVLYRDFTENSVQLCIYSFTANASPAIALTFKGTPDKMTEQERIEFEETERVKDLLVYIPLHIQLSDEEYIMEVKECYEVLNDNQKAEISNRLVSSLFDALDTLENLKAEQAKIEKANAVDVLLNQLLMDVNESNIEEAKTAYNNAKNAFDALQGDEKKYLTVSSTKLAEAKAIIDDVQKEIDEAAARLTKAQNVDSLLEKVIVDVNANNLEEAKTAYQAAKEAFEQLSDDEKELLTKDANVLQTALEAIQNQERVNEQNSDAPSDEPGEQQSAEQTEPTKKKGCKGEATGGLVSLFVLLEILIKRRR